MHGVARFVDELARCLVPACDPAVVRAVFETASAGYAGSRTRDGRRASVLTPSGMPFEASVTGREGRPAGVLRYVTEVASGVPFFRPRLTAQREALGRLVGWLPQDVAKPAEAELSCFVDTLFPDPAAVRARIRFATWFGIVHQDDVPDHLAGLKVYGVLYDGRRGLDRLAARWPAFAALADLVGDVGAGGRSLQPYMADLEIDPAGRLRSKLYLLSTADAAPLEALARRLRADPVAVEAELAPVHSWARVFVCCEADDGASPELSVHVPAKALALDPPGMAALVRRLTATHHGDTTGIDALEQAAAAGTDGSSSQWSYTFAGLGLAPGGGVGKLNVYFAPGGQWGGS